MATPVTFNGAAYSIPAVGERQWGQNVSNFLIAVAGNALSKAGGSFVLTTADVNFGTTYGLVTAYIKGAIGNISSSGVIRLANLDAISWRNAANNADLALRVNASDRLQYGGVDVPTVSSTDTLTGKTMSGSNNTFTNLPVGTTGVAAIANGGTAVSALPTVQSASAFAAWDANQNLSANNIVNDYATTATAAGTTTLTVSSKRVQFFTGSTTQTVTLPVASTLTLGHNYYIRNLSTGVVTIQSSGANTVIAMQPQDGIIVTCILASGTSAASWSVFSELANTSATGALSLPAGTAAQRPTPVAGQVRLNTDSNSFEGYANGIWSSIGGGLNELPQKNYLKTWSESAVAPTYAGSTIAVGGNLVDLVSFHRSNSSNTLTSSSSTTLRGSTNYLTSMADTNSTGTAFIQFPSFSLEGSDLGKPVSISFDVNGVTADGNWDAVIVRYTSAGVYGSIISIAGNASTGTTPVSAKLPTGTTTFNGFFVPDSTTATDVYCLRLRHLVSNAAIRIDTLFIGPQPIRVGAAGTDSGIAYTPVISTITTNVTHTGTWGRNFDKGFYKIISTFSGANTQGTFGGSLNSALPSGHTVDNSKFPTTTSSEKYHTIGTWQALDAASTPAFSGVVVYRLDTGNFTLVYSTGTTSAVTVQTNTSVPITISNGDTFSIDISVPITGWSSNVTMADRAVQEWASNGTITNADDTASPTFVYGPNGSQFPNVSTSNKTKRVRFTTPIQTTDVIVLEGLANGKWTINPWTCVSNGNTTGVSWIPVTGSNTDVDVVFGNAGYGASPFSAAAAWSNIDADANYMWRLSKTSAGAQVGYPISSANIVGRTDGNAPATGMVGEVITSSAMTATALTTSYANITNASLALTSGSWQIYYSVSLQPLPGSTVANETIGSIQLYNNTGGSAITASQRSVGARNPASASFYVLGTVAYSTTVNISSATTYTLQGKRTDGAGTGTCQLLNSVDYQSTFYAIRIA